MANRTVPAGNNGVSELYAWRTSVSKTAGTASASAVVSKTPSFRTAYANTEVDIPEKSSHTSSDDPTPRDPNARP